MSLFADMSQLIFILFIVITGIIGEFIDKIIQWSLPSQQSQQKKASLATRLFVDVPLTILMLFFVIAGIIGWFLNNLIIGLRTFTSSG